MSIYTVKIKAHSVLPLLPSVISPLRSRSEAANHLLLTKLLIIKHGISKVNEWTSCSEANNLLLTKLIQFWLEFPSSHLSGPTPQLPRPNYPLLIPLSLSSPLAPHPNYPPPLTPRPKLHRNT